MTSLADKVVAIHDALAANAVDHAFGGALALAYYAEPRATVDIDTNVFVSPGERTAVTAALLNLGVEMSATDAEVLEQGQERARWAHTPVDLFYNYDPLHEAMRRAARTVPFGDREIPILSPEHLLVCKALFDRRKDWIDIEEALGLTQVDPRECRQWITATAGPDDPRTARLLALLSG